MLFSERNGGDIRGLCVRQVEGGDLELTQCPFTFLDVSATPALGTTENTRKKRTLGRSAAAANVHHRHSNELFCTCLVVSKSFLQCHDTQSIFSRGMVVLF